MSLISSGLFFKFNFSPLRLSAIDIKKIYLQKSLDHILTAILCDSTTKKKLSRIYTH
jgi:hypothetical protein